MCGCFQSHGLSNERLIKLGNYQVIRQSKIAQGAYGDVWKCTSVSSDSIYALKEIKLQNKQLQDMYDKEIKILKKMKENQLTKVITLKESIIEQRKQSKIGCLLFQFGTISLFQEISSKKMTQREILSILFEIATILEEIHNIKVFHLDLKPENLILVNNSYKLCDFGSAIENEIDIDKLTKRQKNTLIQYLQANSTLIYRSPQMIDIDNKVINGASDIWMMGCIAYLMLYRKHPFEGEGKLAIISSNVKYPSEGTVVNLIKKMLTIQSKARPTAIQLKRQISQLLSKDV